jgi:signal peptidase II
MVDTRNISFDPRQMSLNLRNLTAIFLPVLLVSIFDLYLKHLILDHPEQVRIGFVTLSAVANKGIIGGYFSDSAKPIFQIPMITLGFFLLVLLYFLQLFSPVRSPVMRTAISVFFGGIFANVLDRLIHGYVIDYVVFNFFGHASPAFNMADFVQYIGVMMIFLLQFKPSTFDETYSHRLWVSRQFQKRYSMQLVTVGFFLVMVFGALSYSFVRVVLNELAVVSEIKAQFLHDYMIFFLSISVTFLLFLFLVGKSLSAYVAKPILNFEHYLRNLSSGKYDVFSINEPEFAYLEKLSDGVRDHITSLHEEIEQLKTRSQVGRKK